VEKLNDNYPGGLVAYIHNARKLLADSKAGRNPFDGYTPSVTTRVSFSSLGFNALSRLCPLCSFFRSGDGSDLSGVVVGELFMKF